MTKKPSKPRNKKEKKAPKGLDDTALWGHVAASIEPLDERHKNLLKVATDGTVPAPNPVLAKKDKSDAAPKVPGDVNPPPKKRTVLPDLDHGTTIGVDKSTATRLKKGRQPIEGRLDLHGMTQSEAHPALDAFIEKASRNGKRAVLVITGKGTKLDGSVGVLRQAVPRWLNLPPNRPRILAFSHATAKDGGEGALYVLLKRKR